MKTNTNQTRDDIQGHLHHLDIIKARTDIRDVLFYITVSVFMIVSAYFVSHVRPHQTANATANATVNVSSELPKTPEFVYEKDFLANVIKTLNQESL